MLPPPFVFVILPCPFVRQCPHLPHCTSSPTAFSPLTTSRCSPQVCRLWRDAADEATWRRVWKRAGDRAPARMAPPFSPSYREAALRRGRLEALSRHVLGVLINGRRNAQAWS